ncbi:MAG: hypothetical protein JWN58_1586 [Gammaproteobacteria bacterium]|nr:hypothetical protein [Gammaproteobacteria bacterium]
MHEAFSVERDGNVQFFMRQMHENEITCPHLRTINRNAHSLLFRRRSRHGNSGACGGVRDQPAAIESPGCSAAEPIRLTDHGLRRVDH